MRGMPDTLATQLALQMDEFRTRVTRPTALFDLLIQWGESAIRERGQTSISEVSGVCSLWWMDHRPARTGPALDGWFELQVAIESLLIASWRHAGIASFAESKITTTPVL